MPNLLNIIADNPALLQAVKEVFEKQFALDELGMGQTNEILGQLVRARIEGLRRIEEALREIANYKSKPEAVDKVNPAR